MLFQPQTVPATYSSDTCAQWKIFLPRNQLRDTEQCLFVMCSNVRDIVTKIWRGFPLYYLYYRGWWDFPSITNQPAARQGFETKYILNGKSEILNLKARIYLRFFSSSSYVILDFFNEIYFSQTLCYLTKFPPIKKVFLFFCVGTWDPVKIYV